MNLSANIMNSIQNQLFKTIFDLFDDSVNVTVEDENSSFCEVNTLQLQYLSMPKNIFDYRLVTGNEDTSVVIGYKPLPTVYTETTYISDILFKRLGEGNIKEVRKIVDALLNLSPKGHLINKFKEILSPPVVTNTYPSGEQVALSNNVFQNIDTSFKNQWIVIISGEVIDHSKSYKQLFKKYKDRDVTITYFA